MPQQQSSPQQDANSFWIYLHSAEGEAVNQAAEEYYDQQEWQTVPRSPSFYAGADSDVGYVYNQYYTSPTINLTSATNYAPPLQTYHQPVVIPLFTPPPSSPIPIPNPRGPTTESSPFSSLSTSASTSSSASAASHDVCRQAQPNFNEETQQWSCGGCNRTFSDKYGTERHIATVGLKVTCRYCGSRRQAIQRGFLTRNEDDAFLEE